MDTGYAANDPLPLTAITSLRIAGLAVDGHGNEVEVVAPRTEPKEPGTRHFNVPSGAFGITYYPTVTPANSPSRLHPGDPQVKLHIKLGDLISQNTRHSVYNVDVLEASPPQFRIPPLVVKVAANGAEEHLAQEAGMYGHIERLQGVVAPRCYGLFRAPLKELGMHAACIMELEEGDHRGADADVLLLEKVGDHLPFYEMISDELLDDLVDMHADLIHLNVWYNDWRPANLALAPSSPPGLPGGVSPWHGRAYKLRIIDFEQALLTNMMPIMLQAFVDDRLPRLVGAIEMD